MGLQDFGTKHGVKVIDLQFVTTDTEPTEGLAAGRIYYDTSEAKLKYYNGTAWSTVGVAGTTGSLDNAYDNGSTIVVDTAAITLTASVAGLAINESGNVVPLAITKTGTGAGACITISNSGTGNDITGTSSTWVITKAGAITCVGLAAGSGNISSTGTATLTNITSTGTSTLETATITTGTVTTLNCANIDAAASGNVNLAIDAAGSGTVTIAGSSTGAITLGRATTITTGNFTVSSGDIVISSGEQDITGSAAANDILDITRSNSATGGIGIDISMGTAAVAGNAIAIAFGGAGTGDGLNVNMTNNVAGGALYITAAGARTDATIEIVDSSTSNSASIEIANTGIRTGGGLLISYGTAAATEDAVTLTMGTNLAGRAITVSSGATGVINKGSILDTAHTGDLVAGADLIRISSTGSPSSTSNLVAIEQATGAGTAGAYGLYISCTGTNVEALKVDDGAVVIDETLTVSTTTNTPDINAAASGNVDLTIDAAGTGIIKIGDTSTGAIQIGDVSASHYTNIAQATGLVTFVGNARPTKKVMIPAQAMAVHTGSVALTQVGSGNAKGYAFDAAADEAVTITWEIPANWASGTDVNVYLHYAANATSGASVWNLTYNSLSEGEDTAAAGTTVAVTDTTNATANYLNITTALAMANAGLAAGDFVTLKILRDADNAADTLAVDAILLGAEIIYTASSI